MRDISIYSANGKDLTEEVTFEQYLMGEGTLKEDKDVAFFQPLLFTSLLLFYPRAFAHSFAFVWKASPISLPWSRSLHPRSHVTSLASLTSPSPILSIINARASSTSPSKHLSQLCFCSICMVMWTSVFPTRQRLCLFVEFCFLTKDILAEWIRWKRIPGVKKHVLSESSKKLGKLDLGVCELWEAED